MRILLARTETFRSISLRSILRLFFMISPSESEWLMDYPWLIVVDDHYELVEAFLGILVEF